MPSTLFRRFLRRFTSDEADERNGDESDDEDGSRFVPSPLDMSVRFSHGSGEIEADRELARIQREAEKQEGRHR